MKALRKQRLCSFLWGWGKWENRPCSIQKRPGISLPDRFFPFPRWKHMPPYSQFLSDSPSQGRSTYPCNRRNSLRRPPVNPWLSSDRASGLRKKTKGTASAVPPVNPWLSPDRASGLRKRQKGQLASSPCQSMAFTRPRQRSGKKTKGTACVVPPVNLRFSSDRASGLRKRQKGQLALSLLSMG